MNADRVVALLKDLEGWRDYVYDDKSPWPRSEVGRADCYLERGQYKVRATGGTATIGYGETAADFIDQYWGRRITQAEALVQMAPRVQGFFEGVRGCIAATLTAHQWEAITCRAYQTGAGGFCRSETAALLNDGNLDAALERWREEFAHPDRSETEIAHFLTPDEEPMTPAAIILAAMAELESLGYTVVFVDGWGSRGNASFEPQGFLFHHTATPASAPGDYPSLGIVRDGVDQGGGYWLPGPLSQFGGGRSGTIYVVAAGKANHAGGGGWNGLSGNYSVWGCEFENNGLGEPWRPAQVDAGIALAAALAKHTGFGADMVCRHAEWSSAGKIDTATPPLDDGDWIRAQVAARLAGGTAPPPPPPPPEEDDTMRIINVAERGIFIAYGDGSADHIGHPDEVFELVGVGVPYVADKELSAQTFERRWPRAAPAPHAEEYEAMVGEVRARLAPPPLSCAEAE